MKSTIVNSLGKIGFFEVEIARMVELPERGANSFTSRNKNVNITADLVSKIGKSERHAGREAKKKTSATQQENKIFDFLNTPWTGK